MNKPGSFLVLAGQVESKIGLYTYRSRVSRAVKDWQLEGLGGRPVSESPQRA